MDSCDLAVTEESSNAYVDGLVQERRNYSALEMKLRLSRN